MTRAPALRGPFTLTVHSDLDPALLNPGRGIDSDRCFSWPPAALAGTASSPARSVKVRAEPGS